MARLITHVCDRCSLDVPETSPTYQIPPLTLKGKEGEALFHHAGFSEVCEACKDLFIKAAEGVWKKVRGRKKKNGATGASTPGAGVKPDGAFSEEEDDEESEEEVV